MATLEKAIRIALDAHAGQLDKQGDPYILHPLNVMQRVNSTTERIVAVLHDVVEDTTVSLDELRAAGFGADIVDAVDALSRRQGESYAAFIERIKPNPIARAVKIADIEHNMDIRRLPALTEDSLERLQRYRQAWEILIKL